MEETESGPVHGSYLQTWLPSEILLLILQFLPPHDKLRVRATCRRLYSAASAPAAWPSVTLDYYSTRDKKAMTTALRACAPGVRRLSIHSHGKRFPFVQVSKVMTRCKNLCFLSILGFYPTSEQIAILLAALPVLTHLTVDTQISIYNVSQFQLPAPGSSLTSYEARVPRVQQFFALNVLRVWQEHLFLPQKFQLSSKSSLVVNIAEIKDFICNYFHPLPSDKKAQFQLMQSERPLCLAPARPILEVNIGSSCSVSVAHGEGMPTSHPLVLVLSPPQSAIHYPTHNCQQLCGNVPFLSIAQSLLHLSLKGCTDVLSKDLEEVADHCPLLKSLNLESCTNSLVCLSGLQSVAKKCLLLEGLNLDGIHDDIEDTAQLWRILRGFQRLFYLAVAGCTLLEQYDDSSEEERDKVSSLLALEINCSYSCMKCRSVSDRHVKALNQLGLDHLRYLRMLLPPVSIGLEFRELLTSLPDLKCFYVKKFTPGVLSLPADEGCYKSLEKCYIECWNFTMSDNLMAALVSSGTLTHLYLHIESISKEAMCKIIKLPKLVSCHTQVLRREGARRKMQQVMKRAANAQNIPDFSYIVHVGVIKSLETALESPWHV